MKIFIYFIVFIVTLIEKHTIKALESNESSSSEENNASFNKIPEAEPSKIPSMPSVIPTTVLPKQKTAISTVGTNNTTPTTKPTPTSTVTTSTTKPSRNIIQSVKLQRPQSCLPISGHEDLFYSEPEQFHVPKYLMGLIVFAMVSMFLIILILLIMLYRLKRNYRNRDSMCQILQGNEHTPPAGKAQELIIETKKLRKTDSRTVMAETETENKKSITSNQRSHPINKLKPTFYNPITPMTREEIARIIENWDKSKAKTIETNSLTNLDKISDPLQTNQFDMEKCLSSPILDKDECSTLSKMKNNSFIKDVGGSDDGIYKTVPSSSASLCAINNARLNMNDEIYENPPKNKIKVIADAVYDNPPTNYNRKNNLIVPADNNYEMPINQCAQTSYVNARPCDKAYNEFV